MSSKPTTLRCNTGQGKSDEDSSNILTLTEEIPRTEYESLKMQHVGQPSLYDDLGKCNNLKQTNCSAPDTRANYEELRIQEVGVTSQYEYLNMQATNLETTAVDGHIYANSSST